MSILSVKIELLSPTLLAATPPASNLSETLLFIPGNTLRGVLARRYLAQNNNNADADFQTLFITGQTKFGFGLPDGAHFLPLSARSCKYDGGFHNDDEHGVVDLLLRDQSELRCAYEDQDKCGAPIDYLKGFWRPKHHQKTEVHTRLTTRTAIDPRRGTAHSGMLYSQRVVEEGQCFFARIESTNDLLTRLTALLVKPFTARIGTGTSRGQGWVKVSRAQNLADDSDYWGTALDRYKRYEDIRNHQGKTQLVVTLLSNGLFQDEYLRDLTAPTSHHLQTLGIDPAEWEEKPARAFMDTRLLSGFDGYPINLPRQQRLAVAAGSVFLFKSRKGAIEPTLPEGSGIGWIGDGNREGYGYAALWHPFHIEPDPPASAKTQSDLIATATRESQFIRKARELYQQDFHLISKAQMAAVADKIRRSTTYSSAQKEAVKYLKEQLDKLDKKIKRGVPPSSWVIPAKSEPETKLGTLLIEWIEQEKYMSQPAPNEQARLEALRLFWNRFHGFYRFKKQTGEDMELKKAGA